MVMVGTRDGRGAPSEPRTVKEVRGRLPTSLRLREPKVRRAESSSAQILTRLGAGGGGGGGSGSGSSVGGVDDGWIVVGGRAWDLESESGPSAGGVAP